MKKIIFLSAVSILTILLFLQATSLRKQTFSRQSITSVEEITPKKELVSIKEAKKIIEAMVLQENVVGLSISVSLDDTLIWSEGFGHSDLAQQTPIVPSKTHFRIASISKPFTATLLGRLYEEGKVDLDESIYTYVPNFPKKKYDFTLRHLAMHRSGIRHYRKFERENKQPLSIEEGLKKFEKSRLRFEPGTDYQYSSYGYNLLGVAMEKATNKSFEALLSEYITAPLDLAHTVADDAVYENISTSGFFTTNGKGKVWEAEDVNMYMKLPCGGILSTSEDLVRLGDAYSYQRLLQPETQEMMLSDTPLLDGKKVGYGIGWGISTDKAGRKVISHTGGNTGSVCRLVVYPEQKLSIAIVSNTFGIDYLKFIRNLSKISNIILADLDR